MHVYAQIYIHILTFTITDVKLMNTCCLSHLVCFWCLAMKASPMSYTFSLIFSLKDDSARKNCVKFVA